MKRFLLLLLFVLFAATQAGAADLYKVLVREQVDAEATLNIGCRTDFVFSRGILDSG